MNRKRGRLLCVLLCPILLFSGCAGQSGFAPEPGKLRLVATTTMLADLATVIGGDKVTVRGLMGAGVDPHLYQASAGDVALMQEADIVLYNGLHLEGKMGDLFEKLSQHGKTVICIGDSLDPALLLAAEQDGIYDPHLWFDLSLWQQAANITAQGLMQADPASGAVYEENLAHYIARLEEADRYIREKVQELAPEQRVLVTAHDAFRYFGRAYGFEVYGLQGISTDSQAGTADVSALASFIATRQIKAIFVESSVPPKTIQALQAAVRARGFAVSIGGELYSDSLGDSASGADSCILTAKANIDTIVAALK